MRTGLRRKKLWVVEGGRATVVRGIWKRRKYRRGLVWKEEEGVKEDRNEREFEKVLLQWRKEERK